MNGTSGAPKKSFLDNMTPMQVFAFGLIEGILVLCTIGFFILLGIVLDDGSSAATARTARTAPTAPAGNNAPAPTPSAAVSISAVDKENDHIRGNVNAKISIVEFSDFECPFCQRFHETMQQVIDTYPDDVNWVYRHFPLESIHQNARSAAIGSECAAEQGKFWEFADAAFENYRTLADLTPVAQQAGLNMNAFNTCLNSGKYDDVVTADATEAQRAGGRGTPYSILVTEDGTMVPINGAQPFESVNATLQQYLN